MQCLRGKWETLLDGDWHFWIVFLLGHDLGRGLSLNLTLLDRACKARRSGFGVKKKNPFIKRARFGFRHKEACPKPDSLPFLNVI